MKKVVVFLIILLFPIFLFAGTYSGGSGTEGTPYLMSNLDDLAE